MLETGLQDEAVRAKLRPFLEKTRRDFFEQKAAKSPVQFNCQRLTPTRLLKLKKMADASGVFSNTVRGALAIAEAELLDNGIDKKKVRDALGEFRSLLWPISLRHLERPGGIRHTVGDFYPMLQRQAMGWMKQFQRRMTPRCSVKHPWQVIVEDKLPKELFDMVAATVSRTSFGVISVKTQKNCVFAFTSHIRIRNLFSDLTDQSMDRGSFFKRRVKGGKRVEAIINEDKQFDVKYCFHQEMITFDFYYGCWHEHGWPTRQQRYRDTSLQYSFIIIFNLMFS